MKKILLTLTTLSCLLAFSARADNDSQADTDEMLNKVAEFITMERGHMDDWFDYMHKLDDMKFKLLKSHHDQRAILHVEKLRMMGKHGFNAATLRRGLSKAILLHEVQKEEWKAVHMGAQRRAHRLYQDHKAELEEFKASFMKAARAMESEA